ncbi:hypothetical protein ACJMK2_011772 [Sinanodonta woodiana]|uniref:Uncharacterized protein n=1 Tax=Sinanodonta woodiana TaxID=1069815 RepID=A0ABD3V633_SINWO
MVIDLGSENNSPFPNIVDEGSRIRLDGGYPPGGGLNLGTGQDSQGIGFGRRHGGRGLGFLPRIGGVHPGAAGHRHHRGRWAGRRYRNGRFSQDSLGGNGGLLSPEETWRDVPVNHAASE